MFANVAPSTEQLKVVERVVTGFRDCFPMMHVSVFELAARKKALFRQIGC